MARRARKRDGAPGAAAPPETRTNGGTWHLLNADEITRIADAAFEILSTIGLSDAPEEVIRTITAHGGRIENNRLLFGHALIERTIAEGPRLVRLCGQDTVHDLDVGGSLAYAGTGGAAPNILDHEAGIYRPSTLRDLFDAARLTDALDHVRFFSRSLVARDIEDPRALDLNTAFAALAGTTKHVMVQASDPAHVSPIARMCHRVAGSEVAFRARPFLSLNINHVVPPLRFHAAGMNVIAEAVRYGIPCHCNVFGQLGASSPVTMAGSVAQTLAETLAGLAYIHALNPAAPRIAGPRPMITDLRTGGMAGGAGEQALATAMCVQVLRHWDLPCSVIAGATDSKLPDAQAGYEKALSITSAIQAGANLVTQAAGSQAGLMGVSFAGQVIDNDMLGAILRANTRPEVNSETLALSAIDQVVRGEGHFLGRAETYARMSSDFLYPELADRRGIEDWVAAGAQDISARAGIRATKILTEHHPDHLDRRLVAELTDAFDLRQLAQD